MERQEKAGITYLFLILLTLGFLLAAFWVGHTEERTEKSGYTIETQRTAQEETAPVRELININTASAGELEALSGVGPALAQAIVEYRDEHGTFTSVDELLNVKGIGGAKLAGLRDEITLGGEEP